MRTLIYLYGHEDKSGLNVVAREGWKEKMCGPEGNHPWLACLGPSPMVGGWET